MENPSSRTTILTTSPPVPTAPPCSSKHPQEPCATNPAPVPALVPAPVPALATCSALGMGHLRTFDRLHRDFSVSCVYLLAGLCPGAGGTEPFRVLVRGGAGGIVGAEVLVHRTRVGLEPGQVTVSSSRGKEGRSKV